MRYVVFVLLAWSVLLAGCGRTQPAAAPQIMKETVIVPQTVVVPQTVIVQQTVVVAATLAPTDTPVPEPTATQQFSLAKRYIPEHPGWKTYEDVAGDFTMQHPAGWVVKDQRIGEVYFSTAEYCGVTFRPQRGSVQIIGDGQDALNEFTRQVMETQQKLDTVKVLRKDFALTPPMLIVQLSVKDYVYESTSHHVYIVEGLDEEHRAWVSAFCVGGSVSQADYNTILEAAWTIQSRQ
jgi:hypothetical protein